MKKFLGLFAVAALALGLGFNSGTELADPPTGGWRTYDPPVTPPPTEPEPTGTDTTIVDPIVEVTETIL